MHYYLWLLKSLWVCQIHNNTTGLGVSDTQQYDGIKPGRYYQNLQKSNLSTGYKSIVKPFARPTYHQFVRGIAKLVISISSESASRHTDWTNSNNQVARAVNRITRSVIVLKR